MKITFIQTGGTIDKDYPKKTQGFAFEITEPAVERILKKLNPSFEYDIIPLIKKDSLEITNNDRQILVDAIKRITSEQIIITHGTDTIIETAKFLSFFKNKTIILTGAMRPERFTNSDADINIGVAIGAINFLKNDIYIAMHGRIFKWNEVKRNIETGQFQEK